MPRPTLVIPALAVVGALVASSVAASAAGAATPHGRAAVTVSSTQAHHVVAPASTRPGIAHLRYTGKEEILVVEAKNPRRSNARQVAKDLNINSPKPLLKNYRLIAVIERTSGIYTHLSSGSYYLADGYVQHFKAADIESMTVTGKPVDARVPSSRSLRVSGHRSLSLPRTLPTSGWLHASNDSSTLCDIFLVAVKTKTTDAQLRALVAHPSEKKVDAVTDYHAGTFGFAFADVAGPHRSSWIHYHGPARRYVAMLEAYNGSSADHLHHGQVRVLTLK